MKKLNLTVSLLFLISYFCLSHPLSSENSVNISDNDSILVLSKSPAEFDSYAEQCADTVITVKFKYSLENDTLNITKTILVKCGLSADSALAAGYEQWLMQFINN
ncbi:MAG TPA: hypothetical protein PLG90_11500 [Ignavibacteria bacterium]|nr:hypothetical protein [Ignavibacteria bacterium]